MYFHYFLQIKSTFISEKSLFLLMCSIHSVPCAKDLVVNTANKSLDLLEISKVRIKIEDCRGLEAKCRKCIQGERSTV